MAEQLEGQQMFQFNQHTKGPQIGTQILDNNLPSQLDFDQKKKQYQGSQVNSNYKYVKGKSKFSAADEIRSFSVKGKLTVERPLKYKCASIVRQHVDTYEVKAFDQEKSGGFKSLWESLVGYTKRQLCIEQGYIYIFQKIKQGYMTHGTYKISDLFKLFIDPQQSKIRFVFHMSKQSIKYKNFQVKNPEQIVQKIAEQASKMGLTVHAQ